LANSPLTSAAVARRAVGAGRHAPLYVLVLILFFLAAPAVVSAQAPPEIRSVVSKMSSMGSFRASVTLGSGGAGAQGVLSYSGGKVHLKLGDGRVIASNGRTVIVYNPGSRVAGKQPVGGGGGLGWLLEGFEYRVTGNQATGRALNPGARIAEVKVAWGDGFVLRRLSMRNADSDSWFTITLSNIRPVAGFPAALFSFKPPAGSRTVENPLNEIN
jgi:outer membrane lipoprotein-sorting protein